MDTRALERQVTVSKWVVVIAMVVVVLLYCSKFGWFDLRDSREEWGQFGDFFGGILNPIISAAAFYWLATSILLQMAELQETRRELQATLATQRQQADTALIAAKIERENVILTMLGNKISSLRDRQTHLLNLQEKRGPNAKYFNQHSRLTEISQALDEVNDEILSLELEEAEVFGRIAQQGKEFRDEVAEGYASR